MTAKRFNIKVIPNAKIQKVVEDPNRYKVYVNAPPENGQANQAVVALMASFLKVKENAITIVKGHHSREKVIEVS